MEAGSRHFKCNSHLQNISHLFNQLYNDNSRAHLADVTLVCNEGTLSAHKLVLTANSAYFSKLLGQTDCPRPVFILYGLRMADVKLLLQFMYTGAVDVAEENIDNVIEIATNLGVDGFQTDDDIEDNPAVKKSIIKRKFSQVETMPIDAPTSETNKKDLTPYKDATKGIQTRFRGQKRVPVDEIITNYSMFEKSKRASKEPAKTPVKEPNARNSVHLDAGKKELDESPEPAKQFQAIVGSVHGEIKVKSLETLTSKSPLVGVDKTDDLGVYPCNRCHSLFSEESLLLKHLRNAHSANLTPKVDATERKYRCRKCNKLFSRLDKLKYHMHISHSNDKDYVPKNVKRFEVTHMPSGHTMTSVMPPGATKTATQTIIDSIKVENDGVDRGTAILIRSKRRGRPRTKEIVLQKQRRPRGRPRKEPLFGVRVLEPGNDNYDLATLPYGDLSFLTSMIPTHYATPGLAPPISDNQTATNQTETDNGNSSGGGGGTSNNYEMMSDIENFSIMPLIPSVVMQEDASNHETSDSTAKDTNEPQKLRLMSPKSGVQLSRSSAVSSSDMCHIPSGLTIEAITHDKRAKKPDELLKVDENEVIAVLDASATTNDACSEIQLNSVERIGDCTIRPLK